MHLKRNIGVVLMLVCLGLFARAQAHAQPAGVDHAEPARPHILVIMVDDMGFSDLGCFGGEIRTPNLDRLADNGLRFTQFYNTAKCHSSRICLLTGLYSNQAGQESMAHGRTIAETLGSAGYFTAMAGKWHLKQQPTDRGFDRYFGHLSGATNFFTGDNTFRLNGEPWSAFDEDFYTTTAFSDYGIRFIDEAKAAGKPMLLYLAYNAPHYPLHCLEEDFRVYEDTYKVGWDEIREARLARQEQLKLFGGDGVAPAPRPNHVKAWDKLSNENKQWEAERMAAYAAMVHRLDIEIGRVIDHLRKQEMLDNTLVLFVSDNGACPFDRTRGREHRPWDARSYWCYSPGWAHVCNAPFRLYKQNQHEGGITSPAIAHWPGGLKAEPGSITHDPVHLIDIMPTVLELIGLDAQDGPAPPPRSVLHGRSLLPLIRGEDPGKRDALFFRFSSNRAVRIGDWKLVSFRGSPWELYNLAEDRTELHDLAADRPDLVKSYSAVWMDWAEHVNHMPPNQRRPVKDKPQKPNF